MGRALNQNRLVLDSFVLVLVGYSLRRIISGSRDVHPSRLIRLLIRDGEALAMPFRFPFDQSCSDSILYRKHSKEVLWDVDPGYLTRIQATLFNSLLCIVCWYVPFCLNVGIRRSVPHAITGPRLVW